MKGQSPVEQYPIMTEYLSGLYGQSLFEWGGIVHPTIVFKPEETQINDVDSVLGKVPQPGYRDESFPYYNHAYLHTLQNSGRNLFNGMTFALQGLQVSPLKMTAKIGRYYDMLATCATLEQELRDSAHSRFIRLVGRSQYHRHIPPEQAILNGAGRSAAIGVATLVVILHDGIYKAILAQRSPQAAVDPLFFHLLPAFIFQPSAENVGHPREWSVEYQIYREFLEELFSLPEVNALERFDYFYQHPAYVDLRDMMTSGLASLHLTGVAINLLTLRPEICTLLLIRDANWYPRVHNKNSDVHLNVNAEVNDNKIVLAPIESDDVLRATLPENVHTIMPPHATAAMWLGVDLARALTA